MKQTVNNDTIQLIIERRRKFRGIVTNRIYTDKEIARKNIALTIIKSNDISIIIMLKVLHIDIEDIRVRTENNINITDIPLFGLGNKIEPTFSEEFLIEVKNDIL